MPPRLAPFPGSLEVSGETYSFPSMLLSIDDRIIPLIEKKSNLGFVLPTPPGANVDLLIAGQVSGQPETLDAAGGLFLETWGELVRKSAVDP
jgi:hypothetical protein